MPNFFPSGLLNKLLRKALVEIADDLTELVTQKLNDHPGLDMRHVQQDLVAQGAADEKPVKPSSGSSG